MDFLRRVQLFFQQYPTVLPSQLEFEVLETGALENIRHVSALISSLQQLGVACALDDFGTGYSSLTFLKQLPAHTIKIDQSFIGGMLEDPEQLVIVDSVLQLSRRFGRRVVAEGVSSERHGQMLLALGCELAQGYGIAMPMSVPELIQWQRHYQVPSSWLHIPQLPPEGVQALIAAVEHMQWYRQQRLMLSQPGALTLSLDGQCRLTNWLHEIQTVDTRDTCYSEVVRCHQQLHEQLDIAALQQERTEAQLQQLDKLAAQLSSSMLDLLWSWFVPVST